MEAKFEKENGFTLRNTVKITANKNISNKVQLEIDRKIKQNRETKYKIPCTSLGFS